MKGPPQKEAEFYEKLAGKATHCLLCPHSCRIAPGREGRCSVRHNVGGTLLAQSYGAITSMGLDPIEKKPLQRFHRGSNILSLGSYGCNLRCPFCQNYGIAQEKPPFRILTPDDIADASRDTAKHGNIGVAYTYNEPLVGYEFVRDTAQLIQEQGQKNVLVTNGYINAEPLEKLLPLIDALNIDLKAFDNDFYRLLGGNLEAVRRTIRLAAEHCHVEITTLIIPGKNDSVEQIRSLAYWLSGISRDIPLHISRFFPAYQWRNVPPTPVETIYSLAEAAREYLTYVYTGNC